MLGRLTSGGLGENAPKWVRNVADQFTFLLSRPNEEVQALLMDAMRDPKLSHRLLRNANELDAQSLSKILQTRAVNYSIGADGVRDK
jgi:hypothetical protein